MAMLDKITISLPREMVSEIKAAIAAGEFTSASEVVRDALRQWRRSRTVIPLSDEELRRLAREGRESGEPFDGEAALGRLRAKYEGMSAPGGR